MINILKTCRLFLSIISLFILFGMTIVIGQEGLLDGKIIWHGIVHGDSIDVNYRWSKKGWLSDTVKDFSFNGTLKK